MAGSGTAHLRDTSIPKVLQVEHMVVTRAPAPWEAR